MYYVIFRIHKWKFKAKNRIAQGFPLSTIGFLVRGRRKEKINFLRVYVETSSEGITKSLRCVTS